MKQWDIEVTVTYSFTVAANSYDEAADEAANYDEYFADSDGGVTSIVERIQQDTVLCRHCERQVTQQNNERN